MSDRGLLEDDNDDNPIWDVLAKEVWPSSSDYSDRENLANELMYALYGDNKAVNTNLNIILSRLVQLLMGTSWMELKKRSFTKERKKYNYR